MPPNRMRPPRAHTLITLTAILFCAHLHAELANGVKAIVGDTIITYQQVEASSSRAIELLRRQYATQPELLQKKTIDTFSDALEDLVQRQLILHDFKTSGYNLPENIVDQEVQRRTHDKFGDRATLTKSLQAEHMTYEAFRQQVKENIIVDAMRSKYVSSGVTISPRKIETYYAAHQDDYKLEDEIKLRMIAVDNTAATTPEARKKLATEILGKINEGAAFSEMAAVYSTDTQRLKGGDRGWVQRSVLRKELADTAFTLKPGQHSGVIETLEACYIILVEDIHPAHIKPLNEVRDDIEKTLLTDERARLQKEWIDRLKKKTFVRYF